MRNLFKTLVAVLWVNGAWAADRPWLQITVPSAAEAAANFPSPPPENGMTLGWGWNGLVNEQVIQRASYLLSLGTPAAQIGVVMPTTSLWLGDRASDTSNLVIARKLLESQRDFDWVDERSLASVLKLEGSELRNLSGRGACRDSGWRDFRERRCARAAGAGAARIQIHRCGSAAVADGGRSLAARSGHSRQEQR